VEGVPLILDNLEESEYIEKVRGGRRHRMGLPAAVGGVALLAHQRAGLEWLEKHWAHGEPGALLADDMGLGKTLQALAFLAWVKENTEMEPVASGPALVVAPTGLLRNWEDEVTKHLGPNGLGYLLRAYGSELRELASVTHREQIRRLCDADWVATTYETLRDRIQTFIGVRWSVVVFDEIQKIKNPAARMTEMAKAVAAEFVLALTGTPVENRLADLWSIVDTVHPGFLGSLKEFHQGYEKPAAEDATAAAPLSQKLLSKGIDGAPALMLRRLKEDHLEGLPEKTEHLIERPMPVEQVTAYDAVLARASGADGKGLLPILMALRRVSLVAGELGAEGLTDGHVRGSARLSAMVDVLDKIQSRGEKALVFVEFLDLQQALVPYLQSRYDLDQPPLRISGGVAGVRRKQRVDEFQGRPEGEFDVMLLSPKAGGVGLTLTAANHVIHLTRWWNPAVEDQCTDRVYRIGQTRPVHVHYPVAVHPRLGERSFDHNLHALLMRKRELSRTVLAPPIATDDDIAALYEASVGV